MPYRWGVPGRVRRVRRESVRAQPGPIAEAEEAAEAGHAEDAAELLDGVEQAGAPPGGAFEQGARHQAGRGYDGQADTASGEGEP
jgi:hypothetical protein